ncbi:hypothetical protein FOCC_FOCC013301 [Frankliniella occidentalis]|nr:hypothetical protein FOCC_FOCC013301 [Frankliniella occidentalis]
MEQDTIVQGFMDSEETHKLQNHFYIGDGDSSTFAQIVQTYAYGREVRILHCDNHVTVRLSDHLHGLLKKTKEYPVQAHNLLKPESVSASAKGPDSAPRRSANVVETAAEEVERYISTPPLHASQAVKSCYAKGSNGKRDFPRLAQLLFEV